MVGDVVQQGNVELFAGSHRRQAQVHRAHAAVGLLQQHFAGAAAALEDARLIAPRAVEIGGIVVRGRFGQQGGQVPTGQLGAAVAQAALAGRVGVLDAAILAEQHQAFVHALDDHAQVPGLLGAGLAGGAEVELGTHAGDDFGQAQRLGDVVGGALVETGHDVLGLGAGADKNDRDVAGGRVGLQAAAGFQAVQAGQHDVEQDQVGLDPLGEIEGALAGNGNEGAVTLAAQHVLQQAQAGRRVVDDQDRGLARGRCGLESRVVHRVTG